MSNYLEGGVQGGQAELELGPVALNVANLDAMREFYAGPIGLEVVEDEPGSTVLGSGGHPMVQLREASGASPRPPGTSGLFHLAVLEPDRQALAATLSRLLDSRVPLGGASDHIVSEALYLDDPEGNGIEIYRDRPASEWTWTDGRVEMATLPLDLAGLLADASGSPGPRPDLRLGHVHLNVGDLPKARAFYEGVIGLDVTTDRYPGALFVSAGGYHHHIGLNVWQGIGAPPPPPGSLGIAGLTMRMGGPGALDAIEERAQAADVATERDGDDLLVTDPFGVPLRLVADA